jgi:hypothetical protein
MKADLQRVPMDYLVNHRVVLLELDLGWGGEGAGRPSYMVDLRKLLLVSSCRPLTIEEMWTHH